MKDLKVKNILICFLFILIFFNNSNYVYAEGGNGSGSSTNTSKPLNYVSCTLEDGSSINVEEGITTEPKFKIQFDKNVVGMLVWENNSKCFTMTDGNSSIPIVVSKIDDTVDFDNRQVIFLKPSSVLQPGKTYYINVSPKLIAKNGQSTLGDTTNGNGVTISFKTKEQSQPVTQNSNASNNAPNNTENTTNQSQSTSSKSDKSENSSQSSSSNEAKSLVTVTDATNQSNKNHENVNNSSNTPASEQNSVTKDNEENASSISSDNVEDSPVTIVSNKETAVPVTKGLSLNTWLEIGTGIIIICWILVEVLVRRRKKKGMGE